MLMQMAQKRIIHCADAYCCNETSSVLARMLLSAARPPFQQGLFIPQLRQKTSCLASTQGCSLTRADWTVILTVTAQEQITWVL